MKLKEVILTNQIKNTFILQKISLLLTKISLESKTKLSLLA